MRLVVILLLTCLSLASQAVTILQYHHIADDTPRVTSASLAEFKQHIALLERLEYQVIALPTLIDWLKKNQPLPNKAVVITFDDGYSNILSATDFLASKQLPFTVFVNPGLIDTKASYVLGWDALRKLAKQGGTIANHSMRHDYLPNRLPAENDKAWQTRILNDIDQAEARIKQEVGHNYKILAYPYGEFNGALQTLLAQAGYIGVGQHSGAVGEQSDLTRLPRYPASGKYAELKSLESKVTTKAFVVSSKLPDPETTSAKPYLDLTLKVADFSKEQVACYMSGQGKMTLTWHSNARFSTQPVNDIPQGRSRINCTAPSLSEPGRYYWLSQPWIYRPNHQPR